MCHSAHLFDNRRGKIWKAQHNGAVAIVPPTEWQALGLFPITACVTLFALGHWPWNVISALIGVVVRDASNDDAFDLARRQRPYYGGAGMTQDNSNMSDNDAGSGDLFNTAAGWVLFAAGLGLGLSILSGKYFHADKPERPETLGYIIEGVEETGGEVAKMTMAEALNKAGVDASAGEKAFAKCAACHTIEQGGANGVGPNLYGVMGSGFGNNASFSYSSALTSAGGTWGWDEMNDWLDNPRGYIDGTSMGFAGISKIEDRAALALYLNTFGSNLEVPSYVADLVEEADADEASEVEAEQNVAEATSEETAEAAAS